MSYLPGQGIIPVKVLEFLEVHPLSDEEHWNPSTRRDTCIWEWTPSFSGKIF